MGDGRVIGHGAVCQLERPTESLVVTGRACVAGALMAEMSSRPGNSFRRPMVVIVTWWWRTHGSDPTHRTSCIPR